MDDDVRNAVCDFDNLHKAMLKCKRGVMWKDSVARCNNNGLVNMLKLSKSLEDGTYRINDYYRFTIYEPKKREIVSTKFKDRVFQRSLCDNYLYDAVTRTFIYDNGACQVNRGTDFSRRRLKTHLQRYYRKYGNEGYVLKIDFKNYFGSTPHATVKKALEKVVDDKWAYEHTCNIVDSYDDDGEAIGLGLGSQVTQLVQLLVLSGIDHHIKEKLRVRYYIRYMDDLILISNNKDFLKVCLEDIDKLAENLGLTLNQKKTKIFKLSQGINFLGFKFKVSETGAVYKVIIKENINNRKRKLRKHKSLALSGKMTKEKADACFESWKAHAKNGNSHKLIEHMDKYYTTIWEEHYVQKIDGNGATQERVC